uniref:Integrase catalytic domain-containing protein n=2 Tax=Knipowitschia caucasica TaxID=637954 RepID=A0AAV2JEH2_KNICA
MNKFQRDNWRKYSLKFTVKDGELFYWRGMTVMIDNWIAECDQCQREGKTLGTVAPLQTIKVSAVWELLGIDLTGPFPKTTDGYQHGCPKRILSDQGRDFVNELNDSLCSLLGIERSVTAAYHPQTNGALMKLVNEQQNNWDTFLDATLFSLRSKVHISTKHTPFQLMYGREAVFPSEVPVDYPQVGDHDCHPLQDTLLWRAASIHQDTAKCDSYTPMELESEKALDIQTEQSNEGMPHWAVFIQSSNPKYNKGKQTAKPTLEADQDRKPTHWPSGSVNSSRILSTSHAGMTWLPVVPSTS